MGLEKWIPWQLIARKAAKAYGFNDPVETLERIRKFSRPSETNEPIELLRAGFAFHARGLSNTKAIQNNLDWVWPFWIQKQYNPRDESFIPRAFSFSHINLTQRNWTAVSMPDCEEYAIVDPRGLVTPFHDSWSIDFWIITDDGELFLPCKEERVKQDMITGNALAIETTVARDGFEISTQVRMRYSGKEHTVLSISLQGKAPRAAKLVMAIRPYNPEGIQFIDKIEKDSESNALTVNGDKRIILPEGAMQFAFSNYQNGDVAHCLDDLSDEGSIECEAGMASAAAVIDLPANTKKDCEFIVPIATNVPGQTDSKALFWNDRLARTPSLRIPSETEQIQYERSLQTLAQLSPNDIYPGPYTYRRFWFRDACIIAHALLRTGQEDACLRAMENFPARQNKNGYFLSQEGEWDSNGQVLWLYDLYEKLTGKNIPDSCYATILPAAKWIVNKRCKEPGERHDGLLPAGFSAEHFGPNDFYYWDDFWAVAGLRSAHDILKRHEDEEEANWALNESVSLLDTIESSLDNLSSKRAQGHLPASPYRRMDSGAIGSLVSDYPLQIFPESDTRVTKTANYLFENCLVHGAFFQDMIHSGLNIYLTLDLAQTFLRAGDPRWEELAQRCLELASPTGQWPEAINPRTLGGCMGDGQHAWAAAEWLLFALNRLIREENGILVIGSGVTESWIQSGDAIGIDDAPTSHGPISIEITQPSDGEIKIEVHLKPRHSKPPIIRYAVPGYEIRETRSRYEVTLKKSTSVVSKL